uniref:CASP8 and FADD-like apoptosis regulator n=1 Tax=Neogobius melanostomus TaxID=47308 RepID=A0A8C6TYG3_9GOBI
MKISPRLQSGVACSLTSPLLPLLTQLCDALSGPERRRLVFLCGSLDPDNSLVTTRDVLEAAVRSSDRPREALREVLVRLGRLDLLRSTFHCGREEVERQRSSLSRYRSVLHRVILEWSPDAWRIREIDNMTSTDLDQFKFMLGRGVPRDRLEKAKCFLDVVTELEKLGQVSSERVELIETCMRDIGRVDLARRVCTYKYWARPILCPHCSTAGQFSPSPTVNKQDPCSFYRANSIEHYKLNTNPRGVCIIIDCVGHDGELVKQTFQTLGFTVVLHRWLCVSDCISTLRALQHSPLLGQASAFVCCVISRGNTLHLLATDAQCVGLNLNMLREMFTPRHCPVLAGKPKLFFIQRYSVPQLNEGRGYQHRCEDLETDGPGVGYRLVPTDADVFWSHCWTSESQLQRRGHNSQYLRFLTEALKAGRWHVVDLHTRRNPSEQYHLELKHTLTKNLYLH